MGLRWEILDICCHPSIHTLTPFIHIHAQIAERKRTTERCEDYDALMDKLAAMLLAGCQRLGLLLPGGVLPPGVDQVLRVRMDPSQCSHLCPGVVVW